MRRRLILYPLVAGAAFGGATIGGVLNGIEHVVALGLIGAIGAGTGLWVRTRALMAGFTAGFVMALTAIMVQGAFLDAYFINNPGYGSIDIPFGLTARQWTFGFAPLGGLVAGFMSAIVALIARAMTKEKP